MIVGYARTSTLDQLAGLEAQERELRAARCERTFVEQVSSVDTAARAQLAAALDFVREGDVLAVTKLDRLARSVPDLLAILDRIAAEGASLRVLNLGIDTATPTGKLMLTMLGAVGAFEREIMLERQREGIAKAKAEGRYMGRTATARAKSEQIRELHAEGFKPLEIAKRLGISRASVYRQLPPAEEAKTSA
jgi:DNA invertase Pin-like site-specific DNA recombinase